jgi:hypothetical protein
MTCCIIGYALFMPIPSNTIYRKGLKGYLFAYNTEKEIGFQVVLDI